MFYFCWVSMQQCTGSQRESFHRNQEWASGGKPGPFLFRCETLKVFYFNRCTSKPFPSLCAMWYLPALWPVLADHIKLNHWAHLKEVFQENFWSLLKFLLDLSLGVHVQINWIDPLIQYFMLEGKWKTLNFQKWRRFLNSPYQAGLRAEFLHPNSPHCLISLHHRYSPHSLNYCRYAKHTKMHKKETVYKYRQETKRRMG